MLRKISLAALVALPLLLDGCGSSNSGSGSGNVRLVNATTDYPSLDLTGSSGNGVSTGAKSFDKGSYGGVDAGTQTLTLKDTNTGSTVTPPVAYPIGKDTTYSIVAYLSPEGALTGALLSESEAAPTSGTAKLRIYNTIYNRSVPNDTDKLDAYVATTDCADPAAIKVAGGTPPQSGFVEIRAAAAGTPYHVCITGANDSSDLRLDLPAVTLKDQQVTTLVLTPSSGGVLVNGVQIDQQGLVAARQNTSARVRLVADAANGGTVSATIGGQPAALLPSPKVGGYALVPVGTARTIATSVSINGGTAVAGSVTAAPGADLTLLVTGTADAPLVTPIPDNNRPSTVAASPVKVRVVNGINGLPVGSGVDLTVNNLLKPEASNVLFRTASTPIAATATTAAAPSSLEVTLVVPNGTSVSTTSVYKASGTNAVVLVAGKVYTVFVLGDVGNVTSGVFRDTN